MEVFQERYRGIVPCDRLNALKVAVAGLGAVGRHVVLSLAAMGTMRIVGADPDIVEDVNIGSQGWLPGAQQQKKARILGENCRMLRGEANGVQLHCCRFEELGREEWDDADVVLLCVDSLEARQLIAEMASSRKRLLLVDSRVGAETAIVISCKDYGGEKDWGTYRGTIPPPEDVEEGSCTERMTLYLAQMTASLVVNEIVQALKERPASRWRGFSVGLAGMPVVNQRALRQMLRAWGPPKCTGRKSLCERGKENSEW